MGFRGRPYLINTHNKYLQKKKEIVVERTPG